MNNKIFLAIDYGEKNIGIAFGRVGLSTPVKTIDGKNPQAAINEIAKLCIQNKITDIVMGLPLTYENRETDQSRKTRVFAKLLNIRIKKPLHFVNEFLTTKLATENLPEISPKRNHKSDALSADLILKSYLSEQSS